MQDQKYQEYIRDYFRPSSGEKKLREKSQIKTDKIAKSSSVKYQNFRISQLKRKLDRDNDCHMWMGDEYVREYNRLKKTELLQKSRQN